MFPLERAYLIEKERQADFALEAKNARLYAELRQGSSFQPGAGLRQRMLIRLGELMINWGYQLRSRYETIPTASLEEYLVGGEASPC